LPRTTVNGVILAESDHTEVVEGNFYFLPEPVNLDFFRQSGSRTSCPWKRDANHHTVEAGGDRVEDDAWYYPDPKDAASDIKDHVPPTAARCA
jgi:uncharacterized protein (DUF427 family)